MDVKESKVYNFTSVVGAVTYNFSISAESQPKAVDILRSALRHIADELDAMAKAPTKSN